nr:MAG TPA: hypothetical protein [Herelleviridae sp.]
MHWTPRSGDRVRGSTPRTNNCAIGRLCVSFCWSSSTTMIDSRTASPT